MKQAVIACFNASNPRMPGARPKLSDDRSVVQECGHSPVTGSGRVSQHAPNSGLGAGLGQELRKGLGEVLGDGAIGAQVEALLKHVQEVRRQVTR